jgi:hypothetical protein
MKINNEKAMDMPPQATALPLPVKKNRNRTPFQAEIDLDLAEAVKRELKRADVKRADVIEWGLRSFLLSSNPKLAASLGIHAGEKIK